MRARSPRDKAVHDQLVFGLFADYVALGVEPGSIESRPEPEPDIRCRTKRLGDVAFELTEVIDEAAQKHIRTMLQAREALLAHQAQLSAPEAAEFRRRYGQSYIKVVFRSGATLRRCVEAIPRLYTWLIRELGEGTYGYVVSLPAPLRISIEAVDILFPGPPMVEVAFGATIHDAVFDAIVKKLDKSPYKTSLPVELLAFGYDQPLLVGDRWEDQRSALVKEAIDEANASGHIRRVWLFSVAERFADTALKFVYPELPEPSA
jgi:hypothetical protein